MYIILDSTNSPIGSYHTLKEARTVVSINGRYDWTIFRLSTKQQKAAVRYCEEWLCIEFDENINSFNDCSYFLDLYLEEAKQRERELSSEYSAYLWGND